ncbi:lipopolysaccharide biosynthesis protein [Alloacidobacterium dinghuense]|uniref:Lipopolysaccharide biosynthesis protein n=1 Tax=Alloacidobacterium dinghuense TaxID=2763107 RepID=A0A7G8BI78_9BACT|nr:Wzz/FepE/Etk N-terminal domain-containing protein [Alloacidobacterium dinghuense]QNI32248.1 lipopolysaccharide biosynthesis protein [Alloacidobacterium dinghuense]
MSHSLAIASRSNTSVVSIVESAFRQRRVFLWASLATFLLAMLFIFGTHKKYSSEMVLLIQNARGNQPITAEPTAAMPPPSDVTEEQLNSQAQVLQSQDVLDEVVSPGWRNTPVQNRSQAELMEHLGATSFLAKHLDITPTKKSHLISVELREHDPKTATDTMNHLLAVFLSKQQDLTRPRGASKFFAEEAEKYKTQWAAAQQKLSAYQQQQSITSPGDRETWLQQQLADAEMNLRNTDAQVDEMDKRILADKDELGRLPARQNTVQRTLPDSGYMDQMSTLLIQLQNQRTELLTKYKPGDRLVKQVEDQIASTEKALNDARSNHFGEVTTDVNPTWQSADQSYNSNRAAIQGLKARRAALAASIASLQDQLNKAEGGETTYKSLLHDVTDAENNYQLYVQKRDAAQIADAMDTHELLNVAVVQYPTYSPTPVHPRPLIDTVLAVLSSLFIGAFAVFLAENGRRTFSTPYELEQASKFPVLATVPLGEAAPPAILDPGGRSGRVAVLTTPGMRSTQLTKLNWANFLSHFGFKDGEDPVGSAL